MTYPNAYQGMKKVFTSQIFVLIGLGCTILGAITGGIGLVAGSLASGISGGVFIIAGIVLSILALIFELIGLHQASKDESLFHNAFIWALVNLIVSIIINILSGAGVIGGAVKSIGDLITVILNLLCIVYIFKGVERLAQKLGRDDFISYGHGLLTFLYICYGVDIFCMLMSLLFSNGGGVMGVISVLSFLDSIAMLVGYIMYLVYLSRAKKMLEA